MKMYKELLKASCLASDVLKLVKPACEESRDLTRNEAEKLRRTVEELNCLVFAMENHVRNHKPKT